MSLEGHFAKLSIDCERLWNDEDESLDVTEYWREFPYESGKWFPKPTSEGTLSLGNRSTGMVLMNPIEIKEALMNEDKWKHMFPSIIVEAKMTPLEQDAFGRRHVDKLKVKASILRLSPMADVSELDFERRCFSIAEGWLVVDVGDSKSLPHLRCCYVAPARASTKGQSYVSWIEMAQFPAAENHPPFKGMFGSHRWFSALSRACLRQVSNGHFLSPLAYDSDSRKDKRRLVLLAEHMASCFYSGIASVSSASEIPPAANASFFDNKSTDCPYLAAARSDSVRMPAERLFTWIKSSLGEMILQIPPGEVRNCISLHKHKEKEDMNVICETFMNNSEGLVLIAEVNSDASSVIHVVQAYTIHARDQKSSFLTITFLQPSGSQYADDWVNSVRYEIMGIFKKITSALLCAPC